MTYKQKLAQVRANDAAHEAMMQDAEPLVMDGRDRGRLWTQMLPFIKEAAPHIEGAKLASLTACVGSAMSAQYVKERAEFHKACIDAIVEIHGRAAHVRSAFVQEFDLVPISKV